VPSGYVKCLHRCVFAHRSPRQASRCPAALRSLATSSTAMANCSVRISLTNPPLAVLLLTVRRKAAPHEYSVVPGQVYSPCLPYLIPTNRHSCTEALGKRADHQFSSGSTDRAELRIRVHSLPPYRWCLQMKSRCAMHQTEGVENASPKSERHTKNLGSAFLPYTLRVNLRLLKHCVLSRDNYLW